MFTYESRRENHNGKNTREAREIATRVLGKPLPNSAEIHHVDGNPGNNQHSNLIICEDNSYHQTLHARTQAFLACGHPEWKKCWICGEYNRQDDLVACGARGFHHPKGFALYMKLRRRLIKEGSNPSYALELLRGWIKQLDEEDSKCSSAL